MKKIFILTVFLVFASFAIFAQMPATPPGDAGSGGGPVGGGAPIGSGVVLLMVLAAGYGGKKVYDFHLAGRRDKKRNLAG